MVRKDRKPLTVFFLAGPRMVLVCPALGTYGEQTCSETPETCRKFEECIETNGWIDL